MKRKLLILALIPFFALGCNDLFDTGDADKVWDGLELGLYPLQQEVGINDGSAAVEVQLIGEQQSSDVSVVFNIDGDSSAEEGVHYNLTTSSPVTLESGTSTVDIVVELIEDSVPEGETVSLIINLEDSDGIPASPKISQSTTIIAGE